MIAMHSKFFNLKTIPFLAAISITITSFSFPIYADQSNTDSIPYIDNSISDNFSVISDFSNNTNIICDDKESLYEENTINAVSGNFLNIENADDKNSIKPINLPAHTLKYSGIKENIDDKTTEDTALGSDSYNDEFLPSYYDASVEGIVTKVKNQKDTSLCWAFSTIEMIESNTLMKKLKADLDNDGELDELTTDNFILSPSYLAFSVCHVSDPDPKCKTGEYGIIPFEDNDFSLLSGNILYAMTDLRNGYGLKLEKDFPFSLTTDVKHSSSDYSWSFIDINKKNELGIYVSGYEIYRGFSLFDNDYDAYLEELKHIKNSLIKNGTGMLTYNASAEYLTKYEADKYRSSNNVIDNQENTKNKKISKNSKNKKYVYASYAPFEDDANHAVQVIGYDDNFDRMYFFKILKENGDLVGRAPDHNGAWLCRQSYGNDKSVADKDGFFWISYEDMSISNISIVSVDSYSSNYERIGYYGTSNDTFGYWETPDSTYMATYKNDTPYELHIDEVSMETLSYDYNVSVQIYKNPTFKKDSFSKTLLNKNTYEIGTGEPLLKNSKKQYIYCAGLKKIPLGETIAIAPGETYQIVYNVKSEGDTNYISVLGQMEGIIDPQNPYPGYVDDFDKDIIWCDYTDNNGQYAAEYGVYHYGDMALTYDNKGIGYPITNNMSISAYGYFEGAKEDEAEEEEIIEKKTKYNYTPKFEQKKYVLPSGGHEITIYLKQGHVYDKKWAWSVDEDTFTNGYIKIIDRGEDWIKIKTTDKPEHYQKTQTVKLYALYEKNGKFKKAKTTLKIETPHFYSNIILKDSKKERVKIAGTKLKGVNIEIRQNENPYVRSTYRITSKLPKGVVLEKTGKGSAPINAKVYYPVRRSKKGNKNEIITVNLNNWVYSE